MTGEVGSLILARVRRHAADRVQIQRADRVAMIDVELLVRARRGECAPWLTVRSTDRGQVLTFTDDYGQRYLYRLGRYVPGTGAHLMEWPD